jgi:hypothetical protein
MYRPPSLQSLHQNCVHNNTEPAKHNSQQYLRPSAESGSELHTTDSQSVSKSWCRAQSRTFDQRSSFWEERYCPVIWGAPSLTRGRVCHLSAFVSTVYSGQSVFTFCVKHISHIQYLTLNTYIVLYTFTLKYNKIQYVQYIHASVSPGFVQKIMPYLLGTTAVLDT